MYIKIVEDFSGTPGEPATACNGNIILDLRTVFMERIVFRKSRDACKVSDEAFCSVVGYETHASHPYLSHLNPYVMHPVVSYNSIKWGRLHNNIHRMKTKIDANVSTFVYYVQALHYMFRHFLGHHQASQQEYQTKFFFIIIYFNCKWVFTRWKWYYNKTQHTNNISHK
jgi:hypothetical protein